MQGVELGHDEAMSRLVSFWSAFKLGQMVTIREAKRLEFWSCEV